MCKSQSSFNHKTKMIKGLKKLESVVLVKREDMRQGCNKNSSFYKSSNMSSHYHEVINFSHEDDNKPRDTSYEISLDGNHSNIGEDVLE